MPTAQSTSVPSQKKTTKVDNKIAKAVAKVEESANVVPEQQQQSNPTGATGNKTPQEQPEFIKQSLIIIEKKVRNLEKRRAKLDEYKASKTPLNEDQLLAVSKYDEVVRSMELARELEKQFIALANDALKQQKKQSKKEQLEREEAIKERLKEAHRFNSVLTAFGDETVRNDFLNETNGATKLTQQELNLLDEFSKLVEPTELGNRLDAASAETADHLLNAIEGRNKPITSLNQEQTGPVTYSDLKKVFERILTSSYWTRETQQVEQTQEQPVSEQTEQTEENLSEQVNDLNLNEQQVEQQQQQQQQQVYHQNTSDDYVLVNTSDYHPENTQQQQQQQQQQPLQQQQQQSKSVFTTLIPSTNINEFLQNTNGGINFLQDSEIQLQPQEEAEQTQQPQQTQPQQQHQGGNFQGDQNRENRGGRGGHREYNGNRQNYDQRRNYEQRRSGGGNYQPRNDRGENNGPRNGSGGGGYSRGGRGGYRGGYTNSGPRSGSGGNQYPRQPREHQQPQQPVAQH